MKKLQKDLLRTLEEMDRRVRKNRPIGELIKKHDAIFNKLVESEQSEARENYENTTLVPADKIGHPYRIEKLDDGSSRVIFLNREIMGLSWGDARDVRHKNGDPLDCRRENLEIYTPEKKTEPGWE